MNTKTNFKNGTFFLALLFLSVFPLFDGGANAQTSALPSEPVKINPDRRAEAATDGSELNVCPNIEFDHNQKFVLNQYANMPSQEYFRNLYDRIAQRNAKLSTQLEESYAKNPTSTETVSLLLQTRDILKSEIKSWHNKSFERSRDFEKAYILLWRLLLNAAETDSRVLEEYKKNLAEDGIDASYALYPLQPIRFPKLIASVRDDIVALFRKTTEPATIYNVCVLFLVLSEYDENEDAKPLLQEKFDALTDLQKKTTDPDAAFRIAYGKVLIRKCLAEKESVESFRRLQSEFAAARAETSPSADGVRANPPQTIPLPPMSRSYFEIQELAKRGNTNRKGEFPYADAIQEEMNSVGL